MLYINRAPKDMSAAGFSEVYVISKTWCFSRQRLGLHPGLQRQGGCRGLALGLKGKGINIIILHTNMQTKTDKEPLP